jgi:hypothetical protein
VLLINEERSRSMERGGDVEVRGAPLPDVVAASDVERW